jgi:hypothetical protein
VRKVPSQVPPQSPVPAQSGREPTGAPVTALQVPSSPVTLQASHWPSQRALQHTPSTQKPLWHSEARVQASPSGIFGTHIPARQMASPAHSESAWQSPLHSVAPQT